MCVCVVGAIHCPFILRAVYVCVSCILSSVLSRVIHVCCQYRVCPQGGAVSPPVLAAFALHLSHHRAEQQRHRPTSDTSYFKCTITQCAFFFSSLS